jgi:hypothetical protein
MWVDFIAVGEVQGRPSQVSSDMMEHEPALEHTIFTTVAPNSKAFVAVVFKSRALVGAMLACAVLGKILWPHSAWSI